MKFHRHACHDVICVVTPAYRQALSVNEETREAVGKQLAAVGADLEKAFDGPQDVEGALIGDDVFIVQSRPQP
jgi:phosphoglucan,water dikinase